MNKKNIVLIIFVSVFSFCFGIFSTSLYFFGCSFFEFKLKDITTTLVPITIAVCVTYYLNNKNNNYLKGKEVIITLINRIETDIINLSKKGNTFIYSSSDLCRKEILNDFKQIGLNLNILFQSKDYHSTLPDFKKIIFLDYLKFKEALTDGPFMKKLPKYSDHELSNYDRCRAKLLSTIHEAKLHLYLKS